MAPPINGERTDTYNKWYRENWLTTWNKILDVTYNNGLQDVLLGLIVEYVGDSLQTRDKPEEDLLKKIVQTNYTTNL